VIATPANGDLVAYHARRPSVVTDLAWSDGAGELSLVARAMLDRSPVELVRAARASRARYVVVGPRDLRRVRELAELANVAIAGSSESGALDASTTMLARLACANGGAGAEPVPGFQRVYASARRVGAAGHAPEPGELEGPAISIYRVTDPAAIAPAPEIRPR
jgi:hypothetical protein